MPSRLCKRICRSVRDTFVKTSHLSRCCQWRRKKSGDGSRGDAKAEVADTAVMGDFFFGDFVLNLDTMGQGMQMSIGLMADFFSSL